MKIQKIEESEVWFDNGEYLWSYSKDDNAGNYADFSHLDDEALEFDFPEELEFEDTENFGFRFGDNGRMFFVPCYSEQNGWYSSEVAICYSRSESKDSSVLVTEGLEI